VKERKGPFGVMVGGIVDSVVQTARRRAADREPRALIYDASGRPRMVRPGEPGGDGLIAAAGKLIDLIGPPPAGADEGDAAAEATDQEATAEAQTQAAAAAADADEQPGETPV
jgi:hypothetical protein